MVPRRTHRLRGSREETAVDIVRLEQRHGELSAITREPVAPHDDVVAPRRERARGPARQAVAAEACHRDSRTGPEDGEEDRVLTNAGSWAAASSFGSGES